MASPKTARRNVILPLYIDKVEGLPMLDGYTWTELANGYYGDFRPLPCPQCGQGQWREGRCISDRQPYPTVEGALKGISRRGLIRLIKKLATKKTPSI